MELKSSRIKSAEYNEDTEVLVIVFFRGGAYKYYTVPKGVYNGLLKSTSPGKYFDTYIKTKFLCKKV